MNYAEYHITVSNVIEKNAPFSAHWSDAKAQKLTIRLHDRQLESSLPTGTGKHDEMSSALLIAYSNNEIWNDWRGSRRPSAVDF